MIGPGPIGVFDSGVGGLSVLKEIRKLLPKENLLYFADSAYCPYGGRSPELIKSRALNIGSFLSGRGAKLLVVASNTTSASGLNALRDTLNLPVVGVEPAVKPAAEVSRKIGVLATQVTLASERYNSLLDRYCHEVEVISQPCPGLVELVEEGRIDESRDLVARYVNPLLEFGAQTIVLGCTHYPFLRSVIEQIAGPAVTVVDSGEAVAKQVSRVLDALQLNASHQAMGKEEFFTSGNPEQVEPIIKVLWGDAALKVEQINC